MVLWLGSIPKQHFLQDLQQQSSSSSSHESNKAQVVITCDRELLGGSNQKCTAYDDPAGGLQR
jgi:hypothetical protein